MRDLSYFSKRLNLWGKKCEMFFLQVVIWVFVIINGIMHKKCRYRYKFMCKAVGHYYLSKGNLSTHKCPYLDLNKEHLLDRSTPAGLEGTFWLPPHFPKLLCHKARFSKLEMHSILSNSQPKMKEFLPVSKTDYQGVFQATHINYTEIHSKFQYQNLL